MPAGRPPKGRDQVDDLEGPEQQKRRLKVVLETLSGERTVREACEALGIREARFHELRGEVLQAALAGLESGHAGRPRKRIDVPPSKVAAMEREIFELKKQLYAALVRTEIALVMPHLLRGEKGGGGKEEPRGRGTGSGRVAPPRGPDREVDE